MLPFEHIIVLDDKSKTPVYKQIAFSIINAIRNGVLRPETQLPGSRELAKLLNVHRKTVIAAYDELDAQEWVKVFPRKYVMVSEDLPILKLQRWNASSPISSFENDFNFPFKIIGNEIIQEDLTAEITIDDGHPDMRLSPIHELLKTYRSLTTKSHSIKNANLGTTQGTQYLRDTMVDYLGETRGLNITADNILVTHGAQMSIYLSAQLLLDKKTNIVVGKPNYPGANKIFTATGAKLVEVDVDADGIDVETIEKLCQTQKITAVYVVPHHHYPTTVTLSVERRMKLLELSKEYSFVIIEDDYDYDYHYASSPYLPLASGNHNGNIIYIGSFSKMLDPSLRIGFMLASQNFIRQCTAFRKMIDVGGDGYMQNALAILIKDGELKRHLNKAKKEYHQRRDFLDQLLKSELSEILDYTLPSGGMAIWVQLKKEYPIALLRQDTTLKIVRVDEEHNAFRFGFASMNEKELEKAVATLKNKLLC